MTSLSPSLLNDADVCLKRDVAAYNRAYVKARVDAGLCRRCNAPPAPGKTFCQTHLDVLKHRNWLHKYGVTPERYSLMLAEQGGVCAVCGQPETALQAGKVRALSVDHRHETGEVRGLLCGRCNMALWVLELDPELLERMRTYLGVHQ